MARSPRRPAWVLGVAGSTLLLAGLAGVVSGLFLSEWIYSLLPEVQIDAPATGGAALALGVGMGALGAGHLALAGGVARRAGWAWVPAIVLSAVMASVAVGWAVAAVVSAAAGTGVAGVLVPGGIGLGLVAVLYGWLAASLIRLRRDSSSAD